MDGNWITSIFQQLINSVMVLLPDSPFTRYIQMFQSLPDLAVLNWFFPVAEMLFFWETLTILWISYIGLMRLLRLLRFL